VEETQRKGRDIEGKTDRRRDCCTATVENKGASILSAFIFPTANMAI
jgi:hypothetical protein